LSEIRHAACEPHVVELCEFLNALGVGVTGAGTSTIRVEGGATLRGGEHRLWGDYIEAGSWAVVAAITRGEMDVRGARPEDIEVIAAVLKRLGVRCEIDGDLFRIQPSQPHSAGRIKTGLWPGFPSDLVSLVTVLATQADGRTLVHDWLYELRLFALEQLSGMSADLFLCDPHRIIVTGPRRLRGRPLDSRDLRSGMALIAAALAADGESLLAPIETVERGYGALVDRLRLLGGDVERQA
jgi:UDP-N-acetylglucosamine 1-carboxyvinyltransferase